MNYKDLESKPIFYWFKQISQIPRESHYEKQISDFLVNFAKERNLEVIQDKENNIIIKKEATKGYENSPTICLQGHMDMVAVKEPSSDHDFQKDPIELLVEDGYVTANKTTLGADNGIAVAYSLAILDACDIEHGPLEVLITTDEETGMTGAIALDASVLKAKYLLNLDSEEEGILTVGCSGGVEVEISFEKELEEDQGEFVKIDISGFEGGHSGMEIDKFRANAIKQLARMIVGLGSYKIADISGGVKRNAIPSQAAAIVKVNKADESLKILEKEKEAILHEFKDTDPNGQISLEKVDFDGKVFTEKSSANLIEFIHLCPDGLYKKDLELDAILTSSNLGLLEDLGDKIRLTSFIRSSIQSDKEYRSSIIELLAHKFGATTKEVGAYPGWEKEESTAIEISRKVWKEFTGKEQIIATTHGGLECGILKDKMPDTQMISFGPEIEGAHSPKERLNIESAERNYEFLKEILKEFKN
ncbi:MAG: aminoacyl-histidine dipeptidase [Peptoniphilaceae bacterium]|nr:aminoacyl-histidine dipeptidase [Peptoniphilaceae bacterium]MDY6018370.1 aminoacyl-histidine dipeptidase [Anaerococcus sp.]